VTVYTNNLDMGTEGAAITGGASGTTVATGQTPISSVNLVGAGTCTFSATGKAHGAFGMRIQGVPGDTVKTYWNITASGAISHRVYFTLNAAPSASVQDIVWVSDSAFTAFLKVGINASGQITLFNVITNTYLKTWATAPTVGQQYCLKLQVQPGAGTTDGFAAAQIFVGDTTTQLDTGYTASNLNLGTTAIGRLQWSKAISAGTLDITFDDPYVDNTTVTPVAQWAAPPPPPPPPANVGPTITQPARIQMAGPGPQLLQFVANDPDGTIASGGISWVSGPTPAATTGPTITGSTTGLNTPQATFSATPNLATGRYTFAANTTDNNGAAAAQKTWIVDVPAASTLNVEAETVTAPGYTNVGGAASLGAATRDTDPATYAKSPDGPTGQLATAKYLPFPLGNLTIKAWNYQSPSTPPITVQATVYKEDGVTQVYQTSFTSPTTETATPIALDPAGNTALTGANDQATLVLRRALVVTFAPTQ